MVRRSRLGIFYLKEKFVFHTRRQGASEMFMFIKAFQRPCRTNYISSKIWYKSFIQK